MKLFRSDSPELAHSIASTEALTCWGWPLLTLVCIASAPGLLIVLIATFSVSVRAGFWLGVPVVLALNAYLLWRGRSPRLNWVIAGCADRVFVRRLFVQRGKERADIKEPDVIMFEATEIASMTARIVKVLLYGPKPRFVERLVIEPPKAIAQELSDYIRPSLRLDYPGKRIYLENDEGCLTMDWKCCRPDLHTFLEQVRRECPSVFIAEEHSELDLNGIWNGVRFAWGKPDAQQRHLLARAMSLGYAYDCTKLLSRYRGLSFREAGAYLAEIEQEKSDAGK